MLFKRRENDFVLYYLPALLWAALIFVSSSIPSEDFPHVQFWGWAKLIHLVYYFLLTLLVNRALLRQTAFPFLARHHYLGSFALAVLYGASDEYHQLFTPGRHAQVSDVLIDGIGALLCMAWIAASHKIGARNQKAS